MSEGSSRSSIWSWTFGSDKKSPPKPDSANARAREYDNGRTSSNAASYAGPPSAASSYGPSRQAPTRDSLDNFSIVSKSISDLQKQQSELKAENAVLRGQLEQMKLQYSTLERRLNAFPSSESLRQELQSLRRDLSAYEDKRATDEKRRKEEADREARRRQQEADDARRRQQEEEARRREAERREAEAARQREREEARLRELEEARLRHERETQLAVQHALRGVAARHTQEAVVYFDVDDGTIKADVAANLLADLQRLLAAAWNVRFLPLTPDNEESVGQAGVIVMAMGIGGPRFYEEVDKERSARLRRLCPRLIVTGFKYAQESQPLKVEASAEANLIVMLLYDKDRQKIHDQHATTSQALEKLSNFLSSVFPTPAGQEFSPHRSIPWLVQNKHLWYRG